MSGLTILICVVPTKLTIICISTIHKVWLGRTVGLGSLEQLFRYYNYVSASLLLCHLLRPRPDLSKCFYCSSVRQQPLDHSKRDRWCIAISRWRKKMNTVELSSKGILLRQVRAIQLYYSGNWMLPNMIWVDCSLHAYPQQLISEGLVLKSIAKSFRFLSHRGKQWSWEWETLNV